MKFKAYSLLEVLDMVNNKSIDLTNTIVIGITDSTYKDLSKIKNACLDSLFINCWDLENLDGILPNIKYGNIQPFQIQYWEKHLFSENQANQIIDFLEKNHCKNIIVFCDAGMSRSQAVALFIAKYIYEDLDLFNRLYHDPFKIEGGNVLIYRRLVTCHEVRKNPKKYNEEVLPW